MRRGNSDQFVDIVLQYFVDEVYLRLQGLATAAAAIIGELEWRPPPY